MKDYMYKVGTKHYTIDMENNFGFATKWCRDVFGRSKPGGIKFGDMRWWKGIYNV